MHRESVGWDRALRAQLCVTIVICTIGLANSIYRDLRRTAFHISYEIWRSTDFHSQPI